jgi:hypothetical protein
MQPHGETIDDRIAEMVEFTDGPRAREGVVVDELDAEKQQRREHREAQHEVDHAVEAVE